MTYTPSIAETLVRYRRLMLIHSYIYYVLGDNIVDDHTWQKWADKLRDLQEEHGTTWGFYDSDFEEWDGSTGMHLPQDAWIVGKAHHLLYMRDNP